MRTTLVICLFLAPHLHAGMIVIDHSFLIIHIFWFFFAIQNPSAGIAHSINTNSISTSNTDALDGLSVDNSNATSSSSFDEELELAKIAAYCMSPRDYEELTGNIVAPLLARMLATFLNSETVPIIGLSELRASLNFAPLRPWKHYNSTKPSEEELAAAPSIEAYYDLKEPRGTPARSLDSLFLLEKNMIPAVPFFDKRFPSIRAIFRRRFEEIRRSDPEVIDRKSIDRMIDEFMKIWSRVARATDEVFLAGNSKCRSD